MYDYDDMIQCVTILSKIQYVSIKRVLEIRSIAVGTINNC